MDNRTYSKGISWISDCRIPTTDKQQVLVNEGNKNIFDNSRKEPVSDGKKIKFIEPIGRFPANILVSDDMLNDGKIYKSGEVKLHHKRNKTLGEYQGNAYGKFNNVNEDLNYENYYGDKGTNSRYYDIDKWFNNLIDV